MSISVIDSRIFRNTFGTPAIRDVFSDESYVQKLVEVENALARAQARVGVIPQEAASAISESFIKFRVE